MKISTHLVASTVLVLGGLAPAQGTYTTFGQGCSGTGGGNVCVSSNPNTTAHSNQAHNANIFALAVQATTALRIVTGFELFTQTRNRTTPLTINTQVFYADSTGKPTGSPKATGTMTIGTTAGWYRTTLSPLLLVPAKQKFFISYTSVSGQMFFPLLSTGNQTSYFWHPPTATAWNGTPPNGFNARWAWKVICAGGSSAPTLSNTGVPTVGTTFSVDLTNARANALAIFAIGLSNTLWNTTKLPWELTPLGAKGCNLYVSLDVEFLIKTDASGKFVQKLAVPNNRALKGFKFYNQYAVADPGANTFGVALSNGGAGVVQ